MMLVRKAGKTLLLLGLCAIVAGISVQSAAAVPPTTTHHSVSGSVTLAAGTVCSFPVVLDGVQDYTVTTFFDQEGNVTQRLTSGTEQDTLSANGKTLVGDPYHFNFNSQFENGVRVSYTGTGIAEMVHLPDGSLFIIAGRVDVTGAVVFSVDSGNSGNNVAAFCAALS
jgi:hypothetical protein